MPYGSLVQAAQLNFTGVARPVVGQPVFLAKHLQHLVGPRLVTLADHLIERSPPGTLVDGLKPFGNIGQPLAAKTLHQDMTQSKGSRLAQPAVELDNTFRRGSAIDTNGGILQGRGIHGLDMADETVNLLLVVLERQIYLTLPRAETYRKGIVLLYSHN